MLARVRVGACVCGRDSSLRLGLKIVKVCSIPPLMCKPTSSNLTLTLTLSKPTPARHLFDAGLNLLGFLQLLNVAP